MIKQNYFDASSSKADIDKSNYLIYDISGVGQADKGNYQEALESFTKAISLNPKDPKGYFNGASIKMELGDFKGAILDFKKAEKLHAYNKIYLNLLINYFEKTIIVKQRMKDNVKWQS